MCIRDRLAKAAGYRGWIVLFDEVELIGRYTIGQRAKSYAEIARWVRGDRDDPSAPIGAVLATVDDYETQVLVGKNDLVLIPQRLRASGTVADEILASLAETGMRIIGHEPVSYTHLDVYKRQCQARRYSWRTHDHARDCP